MLGYLIDLDVVASQDGTLFPGAVGFINELVHAKIPFLLLTAPDHPVNDALSDRLRQNGLKISKNHLFTEEMAMARLLYRPELSRPSLCGNEGGMALTPAGQIRAGNSAAPARFRVSSMALVRTARWELALPADQTVIVAGPRRRELLAGIPRGYRTILVNSRDDRPYDPPIAARRPEKVIGSLTEIDPLEMERDSPSASSLTNSTNQLQRPLFSLGAH